MKIDFLKRKPDVIIGGSERPYMLRWWILPRNPLFNIYLHRFLRSDDDRALHDHPWLFNCSILLKGDYIEHVPANKSGWPVDMTIKKIPRHAGALYFRFGPAPHRVQLYKNPHSEKEELPVWTIFITGPRIREWGFYCPSFWRHWLLFTDNTERGVSNVGKGCDHE